MVSTIKTGWALVQLIGVRSIGVRSIGAQYRGIRRAFLIIIAVSLNACVSTPPERVNNVCDIFDEKSSWVKPAQKASKRWGSSVGTLMAFIHQESRFVAKARPPRRKILGFIPGPRPSDAYGYAQVKDATWDWYRKSAGRRFADRDDFEDAVDFIGWYNKKSQKISKISLWAPDKLYLAYHEGHGGYNRRTYRKKPWLVKVAAKVGRRAKRYDAQYKRCKKRLNSGWWFF